MEPEDPNADVLSVWQAQTPETPHPGPEEVRRIVERMERKMRRSRIDFYVAQVVVSAGTIAIAVLFRHPLLSVGAALSVAGGAFLALEVFRHWRRAPRAESGEAPSVEYQQALLEHRLEFHRKRLWLRVLILAPGGTLFFLGFAAARPDLAPIIYFELASFVIILAFIVPVNRRAAAKLERQIGQLRQLQEQK